ncbi:LysE family translocator [Candidatus Albibeggiatoa sp. nov. NOAA]|uniref:LysE family translocator n=1 Tax=Candidatus Albibeggiatoa sp. nov. NOAA TaxID=3162724 RepID=UPI0033048679|nr:LysE family translocator [Thiotrichaceae bacterium]
MISIEFLLTSLVVVLIPGTGVLYTVATGLFIGKRASVFAAIGCTFGIVPALLASVFGLATLFHTSALAFQVVKYVGAAYLIYLAWSMWRSSSPLALEHNKPKTKFIEIAMKGFLMNILNPKLSIFFLAFLPQFVSPIASQPLVEMLSLGIIFMFMTLGVFTIYGVLASLFSQFVLRSEKVSLAIQKIFAGSFAALGLKLAFSERV